MSRESGLQQWRLTRLQSSAETATAGMRASMRSSTSLTIRNVGDATNKNNWKVSLSTFLDKKILLNAWQPFFSTFQTKLTFLLWTWTFLKCVGYLLKYLNTGFKYEIFPYILKWKSWTSCYFHVSNTLFYNLLNVT